MSKRFRGLVSSSGGGGGNNKKVRRTAASRSTSVNWADENVEEDDVGLDDFFAAAVNDDKSSKEEEEEEKGPSEAELRISKAKEYLKRLMDEEENEEGAVSERLQDQALRSSGRFNRKLASNLESILESESESETSSSSSSEEEDDDDDDNDEEEEEKEEEEKEYKATVRRYRGHQLAATCVALSHDDKNAFTGSKDCSIIRWDVESGKRLMTMKGQRCKKKAVDFHTDHVLALAVSPDDRYMVSGGRDKLLRIWDLRTNKHVVSLRGHRDTISSLVFRKSEERNILASGSFDRTIKLWNVDSQTYMETLFGHQSELVNLDALKGDRLVSCGRDATARLWHVAQESQLVFRGTGGSIDCCAMLNEKQFVTGSDCGELQLWSNHKKKPVFTVPEAHGIGTLGHENWISSVASFPNSDVVCSGSSDGRLRFWQADVDTKMLREVGHVNIEGFVNDTKFSGSGRFVACAVGQEHRLGRWYRHKGVRSGLAIVELGDILS